MIRYLLLQNRAGKTRLAKYYIPLDDAQKHALEYEVHKLIANRDPKFTNFVEVSCHRCRSMLQGCVSACMHEVGKASAMCSGMITTHGLQHQCFVFAAAV